MKENSKFKYVINISVLFILGIALLIWGISMLFRGYENRKNLKKIYDNNFNYEKIQKGNYIKVTNPKLVGDYDKNSDCIFPVAMVNLSMIEYDYYIIDFGKIYIPIKVNYTKLRDEIDDKIDKNAVINSTLWLKVEKSDDYSTKILDEINKAHIKDNTVKKNEMKDKYVLSVVDIKQEKKLMIKGLWIFAAAIIVLLGSKPGKIIIKKNILPVKEFNLVYDGRVNEDDMRILENTAYDLRTNIKSLKSNYKDLQINLVKTIVAFVISFMLFISIRILLILAILSIIYFIKLIVSIIRLFLNGNSKVAKKIMFLFNGEPIKIKLQKENEKLEKCMRLIDVCIGVRK